MAHKASRFTEHVLAYDLGGTKVAAGVMNSKGRILEEIRVPVALEQGKTAVINQLVEIGKKFLNRYPKIHRIGVASAGPLDPVKGMLLDPTNFASKTGTWGKVHLAGILKKKLKRQVFLENDAAAAILAEHWVGSARKYKNAMILTLGTGLGTGIICNDSLVRAGRGLHPEAGHLIINHGDKSAPCGCGNFGCAEAYLSGRNFGKRASTKFMIKELSAEEIAALARQHDKSALAAFEEYALMMAIAIHNYVVIYAPEIVIFAGSFANASDLFIEKTSAHLEKMLIRRRASPDLMPGLTTSSLENRSGLIGGAYVAFNRNQLGVSAAK
ncbi:MAG: ROK family protein [Bdellovibrionota bacterium]